MILPAAALCAGLAFVPAPPSASAAQSPSRLYACVTTAHRTLNLSTQSARCPTGQRKISWQVAGTRGARGLQGVAGRVGAAGVEGKAGAAGQAGAAGTQGAPGVAGERGPTGQAGPQGAVGPAGSPDTPAEVLAKLLQVDGAGSGLDADLLGGRAADAYQLRVAGTCAAGSAIRSIAADGTVVCQSTVVAAPLSLVEAGVTDTPLSVKVSNASSGARAIDVNHAGVGPGVVANTVGGSALWGTTGSITAAAVIGDSSSGEAIVARQNGAICEKDGGTCSGIGAIVGRHDGRGGYGVRGFVTDAGGGVGVLGQAGISGGTGVGIRGENVNAANDGNGVEGVTNGSGAGIYGQGATAGRFSGNVVISGDLTVSGTTNGLQVDDPRRPTTQSLSHTPVQTDELTVVYTGNARTDAKGRATIQLPDYATTLAGDWRYQLTPIGRFGQVIVDREVDEDGIFVVRSENGDTRVSWSVTGVRHDPQAEQDGFQVEQQKSGVERGRYLDPSLYGAPASQAADRPATTTAPKRKLASDG